MFKKNAIVLILKACLTVAFRNNSISDSFIINVSVISVILLQFYCHFELRSFLFLFVCFTFIVCSD